MLDSLDMRQGVVLMILTLTELEPASVDGKAIVPLSPLMADVSALSVDIQGVLVVCSVNANKVRLTVTGLRPVRVDRRVPVPLYLLTEDISAPDVDRYGVLVFMVVWSVSVADR